MARTVVAREVMPIYPLPVLSEEEEEKALAKLTPPKTVVVRYGYLKQIAELPYDGDQILGCGTKLVVRTPRGVELGEMLTTTCSNSGCGKSVSRKQMLDYIDRSGGKQYPFVTEGKVLRIANSEDHHPDLLVGYKTCTVTYTTHAVGGLSENDFICAAKLDAL